MKKLVCILILICIVMGAAFAQAKPAAPAPAPAPAKPAATAPSGKLNAIGLDVFQLVEGVIRFDSNTESSLFIICAGYERLVAPHFSIGAVLDLYFCNYKVNTSSNYFNIAAEGRYYPLSENFDKLFLGATLGYSQYSVNGNTTNGNSGLSTSLKMGYKVLTEKGFFLEPAFIYNYEKPNLSIYNKKALDCSLRLGWAF